MTDETLDAPVSLLSAREKRDLQKAQLRPLSNRRPELYEEDEYTSDEYEQMMDMYNGTLASIEEGEIVKSIVLEIRENMVVLDIGFKSEGTIPLEEFKDMPDLKVGDEVEVLLEHLEDQEGSVVLSKKKADFMRVWERIRVAYESDQPVEGTLVKKIKGGVVVDLMGVDAFLPGSQIALRRVPNIDELLGQRYEFKIIKLNKRRRNIVVSRRVILETERAGKREKLMKELEKDQVRKGVVKNITDFGAFLDLDGIDGLLHITDMSWARLTHPSEAVKPGDRLEVVVLEINKDKERISLGLKQLQSNPWDRIEERFPIGQKLKGKVTNLMPYGAFVQIEEGIEGLIHVSELSWTKRIVRPSDVLTLGQEIESVVLGVNKEDQKISLGVRQLEPNPWDEIEQRYVIGKQVRGQVRNMTAYGAFVELEEGIDGMVHVSDISWTKKINHPSEALKKGDEVDAVVIDIDKANQRISLGIKQLETDPWKEIEGRYKVGDVVKGTVSKIANFGAFVELPGDIDGLVHISQISEDRVEKVKDVLKPGQEVEARVIKIDKTERRLGLSIKATGYSEEALRKESEALESVRSGEDMVSFGAALTAAEEEYRPGQGKS